MSFMGSIEFDVVKSKINTEINETPEQRQRDADSTTPTDMAEELVKAGKILADNGVNVPKNIPHNLSDIKNAISDSKDPNKVDPDKLLTMAKEVATAIKAHDATDVADAGSQQLPNNTKASTRGRG